MELVTLRAVGGQVEVRVSVFGRTPAVLVLDPDALGVLVHYVRHTDGASVAEACRQARDFLQDGRHTAALKAGGARSG